MQEKDFEKLTSGIQEKLGKENASLILDDIGMLISDNAAVNKSLKEKDAMIQKLKQDKESLIQVNGNLLQQVAMGEEDVHQNKKEEEKPREHFNFRSVFDENGNFKR